MANTLNVRLVNKNATLTQWEGSTLPLLEGEVVLAKVMVPQKDGTVAPTYVAKVGLEGKTFNESPWLFANASDVYAWAKQNALPVEFAATYDNTYNVVSNVEFKATTKYPAGAIVVTKSKMVSPADFEAAINAINGNITTLGNRVTAIETSLADGGTIHELIDAAQAQADKGVADAAKVAGDLSSYQSANNARVAAIETSLADGGDIHELIDAAKKAGDDAQDYAEEVAGDLETLTQTVATNKSDIEGTVSQLRADLTSETNNRQSADTGFNNRITTLEGQVSALNAATTLDGVGTLANRPAKGSKNGAIYIATDNNKEYVWDGDKWVELGDTTAELSAISELQETAESHDARIATLEGTDHTHTNKDVLDGITAEKVAAWDSAEADAIAAAKTETEGQIGSLRTELTTAIGNVNANVEANATAIQTLANGAVKTNTNNISALTNRVTAVEGKANDNASDIADINSTISTLATTSTVNTLTARVATIEQNYITTDAENNLVLNGQTIILNCGGAE